MDFPEIRDVDSKLIELAKQLDAKIVTNDVNLNKVAKLHGISVLNINELANALRPVVLPGEIDEGVHPQGRARRRTRASAIWTTAPWSSSTTPGG